MTFDAETIAEVESKRTSVFTQQIRECPSCP